MNQKPSTRMEEMIYSNFSKDKKYDELTTIKANITAIIQYLDEQWEKEQRFSTPESHRVTVEGITNL